MYGDKKPAIMDQTNPFFLHPLDNPRMKNTEIGRSSQRGRGRGSTRPTPVDANTTCGVSSGVVAPNFTAQDRAALTPALDDSQWQSMVDMFISFHAKSNNDQLMDKQINRWMLDTGASYHLTGQKELLTDMCDVEPIHVMLPDGTMSVAAQSGKVHLGNQLIISNVLYVPVFQCNLISFMTLIRDQMFLVTLTDKLCVIQDRITRTVVGVGEARDGVLWLIGDCVTQSTGLVASSLWHVRMGHPSYQSLSTLPGISFDRQMSNEPCSVCLEAKKTRAVFPDSINKATELFELVHADVRGPYRVPSSTGAQFFLTLVDDFSRSVWVFLISSKTEVVQLVTYFCAFVQAQFGKAVKRFRADNGTEFLPLRALFMAAGIIFETSCVDTPQQNGRVERKHHHLLNVARSLMFQASIPIQYWGECVLTAAYLINRTPSTLLAGKTPYYMLFHKELDYTHIKTFGCLCFVSVIPRSTDKFAASGKRCIFMGYPYGKKGWRVLDILTRKLFVSRDVIFHQDQFPFGALSIPADPPSDLFVPHPSVHDLVPSPTPITVDATPTVVDENLLSSSPCSSPASASDLVTSPVVDLVLRRGTRDQQ